MLERRGPALFSSRIKIHLNPSLIAAIELSIHPVLMTFHNACLPQRMSLNAISSAPYKYPVSHIAPNRLRVQSVTIRQVHERAGPLVLEDKRSGRSERTQRALAAHGRRSDYSNLVCWTNLQRGLHKLESSEEASPPANQHQRYAASVGRVIGPGAR